MADGERLYFSIGPVQTFVAQSRRTRDLWASSYLLSHLADIAMSAVEAVGGKIILPYREKQAEQPNAVSAMTVQHGRWPNRFVAYAVAPKAAAEAATTAMLDAWQKVANAVWTGFVEAAASYGSDTRAIWERQVGNFWEVSWVIARAPAAGDPDPLSLRKNWRTTPATVEPGDHCTMMGNWQELSGYIRSQSGKSREKQETFWKQIRSRPGLGRLNPAENERLCAIGLIKRMFPSVAKEAIGTEANAQRWLSTPYIAAIPWLRKVCREHSTAAKSYLEAVKRHQTKWQREDPSGIASLRSFLPLDGGEFLRLDADFLHETALANKRDTLLDIADADDDSVRMQLGEHLQALQKQVGSAPSSFYGMLLMDGDSMGKLLSKSRDSARDEGERQVTEALGRFAAEAPAIVSRYDGVTVYCGGDDVLAMLPVEQTLPCALALSKLYRDCFARTCPEALAMQATISGAIVYCPFRAPFREVLATAHHLLDHVAKDQTGRDSLAIVVLKSGGIACQWSAPWNHVEENGKTILDQLVERFRASLDRPGNLSSGFLFQIREKYSFLTDDPFAAPGRFGRLSGGVDVYPILLAEYVRVRSRHDRVEGESGSESIRQAKETIDLLLKVCRRVHRTEGIDANTLGIDGALLVRFLAGESQEVES